MSVTTNLNPYINFSTAALFYALSENIDNDRLEDAENALNILRNHGNWSRLDESQQHKVNMLAIRILKAYLAHDQIADAKRVANRIPLDLLGSKKVGDKDLERIYGLLERIMIYCIIQ